MKRIALITGASRGIGAATALALAKMGYALCVHYRSNRQAAESVLAKVEKLGVDAFIAPADIAQEQEVVRVFEQVDQQLGRLTALVNNAAILLPQTRVEQMQAERINRLFTTNVTGSFICCREAIKRMSMAHGGSGGAIVNVSSVAARTGSPNEYVDYAASKAALDALTKGLSLEVVQQGIRVNAVRPGFIYTNMHADGGEPNRVERLKNAIPMQRGGQPEEVAAAIAWLLSDEASYITGSFIDVAGGR